MSTAWQVVKPGHPSAGQTGATRNVDAERGVGRAFREETNLTPVQKSTVWAKAPGRPWEQGAAVTQNKDLIGKTGSMNVAVRSGNVDPAAIGISKSNWGFMSGLGDGETAPAPAPAPKSNTNLYLILGGVAAAAFFLLRKKS